MNFHSSPDQARRMPPNHSCSGTFGRQRLKVTGADSGAGAFMEQDAGHEKLSRYSEIIESAEP